MGRLWHPYLFDGYSQDTKTELLWLDLKICLDYDFAYDHELKPEIPSILRY